MNYDCFIECVKWLRHVGVFKGFASMGSHGLIIWPSAGRSSEVQRITYCGI